MCKLNLHYSEESKQEIILGLFFLLIKQRLFQVKMEKVDVLNNMFSNRHSQNIGH